VKNKAILIVDDNQMTVNLIRTVLSGEGYDLRAAFNADEALNALDTFKPGLILMDIQLPGKSGLELTRELRANPEMNSTSIIALSASGVKDEEQSFLSAGCDGYIGKPIDTSTFPETIRSLLDKESRTAPRVDGDVTDLLRGARNNFITESLAELTEWLSPDSKADKNGLLRMLDRWAGVAGTLGMPGVADQAKSTKGLVGPLEEIHAPAVREALQELQRLITAAAAAPAFELALPSEIVKTISGKRIALAGFSEPEARRFAHVLDRAECFTLVIEAPSEGLSTAMVERFDIIVLNVVGADGYTCLKNTSLGLSPNLINAAPPQRDGPAQVIIADDDPAIGALLTATLRRTGAECRLARNGAEALALAREVMPDALILDVNMPGMDGFEVLTNLRADQLTKRIPVVLLTARQQETDVLKGFSCGANDYIRKPFNPMEVTARVARYLPRKKP